MTFVVSYLGVDGSGWNLSTGYEGVKLMGGVEGLDDPAFTPFWSERIGDGDRYRGSRLVRRSLPLPLLVGKGEKGLAWRELDRAWWRAVDPDAVGLLDVAIEDASHRYLPVHQERATGSRIDFDPALTGWRQYLLTMVADDPLWRGDDVVQTWQFSAGAQNFYGGSGGGGFGPPFYLADSQGFGMATVSNPGDVPAWPTWQVTGPCAGAVLTVDGHSVAIPQPIGASTTVHINSEIPSVFGDFTESQWHRMTGAVDFAPVPKGASVPVTAQMFGPGVGAQARMTITPKYKRAW